MIGIVNAADVCPPHGNRKPSVDSEADDDNGGGVYLHEFAAEDAIVNATPPAAGLNGGSTANGDITNGASDTNTSAYDVGNGGVAPHSLQGDYSNAANTVSSGSPYVNGHYKVLDPTSKAWEPVKANPNSYVQAAENPSANPIPAHEAGNGTRPVVKLPPVTPRQYGVYPAAKNAYHSHGGVSGARDICQFQFGITTNSNPPAVMNPGHHAQASQIPPGQPQNSFPGVNGYGMGNHQVSPAYGLRRPKPAAQGGGIPSSFTFPPPGQLAQSFSTNSVASVSTSGCSGTTRTDGSIGSHGTIPDAKVQYTNVAAPAVLGQNCAIGYQYDQRHAVMPAYGAELSCGPVVNGNTVPLHHHQVAPAGIQLAQNGMYANQHFVQAPAAPVGPMSVVPYQPAPAPTVPGTGTSASIGPVIPYQGQSQAMTAYQAVPDHIKLQRSALLNDLTASPTGRPTLEQALDPKNFPFMQSSEQSSPGNSHGVVKLKNIPFSTVRAEVIAFLGRNSKILNDNDEGVHIIMERVTSKTNDAYVEFMTLHDAMKAVDKHHQQGQKGRLPRLQDRPIEVELSSQAALMKDLFPLARGIFWEGAVPLLAAPNPKEPWNIFKGFISEEEMTMLVKNVEIPLRSPYTKVCPQRPYESMISTLKKLPWYKPEMITIRQRESVFKSCLDLIRHLQHLIEMRRDPDKLTPQLLKRLVTAAMQCPGFTVLQKDNVAYQVSLDDPKTREYNQPRFANSWLHQYSVAPKPGTPLDVIEWYIAVIREESTRMVHMMPLNDRARVQMAGTATDGYWGYFWYLANFPVGPSFDELTMAAVTMLEFEALQRILQSALRRA